MNKKEEDERKKRERRHPLIGYTSKPFIYSKLCDSFHKFFDKLLYFVLKFIKFCSKSSNIKSFIFLVLKKGYNPRLLEQFFESS